MAKKTVLFVADEDNFESQFLCDGDISLDNCYQRSMEGVIKYERLEEDDDSLIIKDGVLVNGDGEILSHREDDYISVVCSMEPCCTYIQKFVVDCPEDMDSVWFVGEVLYHNLPEHGRVKRALEGKVYLTEEEAVQACRDQFNIEINLTKVAEDWFDRISEEVSDGSESYLSRRQGFVTKIFKEDTEDWLDDYLNDPWEDYWASYEEDCNEEECDTDSEDEEDVEPNMDSQPKPKEEPTFLNFLKDALQSNAIMGLDIEED